MEGTVDIVTLDQKPCVVHYLENYNKFLVATYELFTSIEDARLKLNLGGGSSLLVDDKQLRKQLEKINYRAGKFILLRGNEVSLPSIEYEFECFAGGGVFDAKVKYNKIDSSYKIYAAHSNGTIGIYKLSLHCGNKICLKEHINVPGSSMLTCIDIFPDLLPFDQHLQQTSSSTPSSTKSSSSSSFLCSSSSQGSVDSSSNYLAGITTRLGSPMPSTSSRIVVGDSDGFVTILTQGEPIRENVTHGDSIWQVACVRLLSGKDVIVVGADNCTWYIYGIDEIDKRLILLYKNAFKDFNAGITSVSVLDIAHLNEYDLIDILLGSYDESLQVYQLKINHDGISKPGVCHKNTVAIEGGGIWRIKPCKSSKGQLCVAAMYAGSYLLSLSSIDSVKQSIGDQQKQQQLKQADQETITKLIDLKSLNLANKPLHYDIDVSSCNTTFCIVDFNNSLCIFKTVDP